MSSISKRLIETAIVVLSLFIGISRFYDFNNTDLIAGDLGDARFNMYILEHGYLWVTGQVNSFWDAPFFYPVPNVVAYSDNHLGSIPIYSPLRLMGYDRETAFQLWIVISSALNYLASYWVLRKFGCSILGCALGAYVFAFSLASITNLFHAQLNAKYLIPFIFYFTVKFLSTPSTRNFAFLCTSIVGQIYIGMYMGFFSVLGFFVFSAVLILRDFDLKKLKVLALGQNLADTRFRALIVVSSIVALSPIAYHYGLVASHQTVSGWNEISSMVPRLSTYFFTAAPLTPQWAWLGNIIGRDLPMAHEHIMFIGIMPWLALVYIPILFKYVDNKDSLLSLGMSFFYTLLIIIAMVTYIGDFTFYKYLAELPGFDAFRGVSRIVLMLSFPFAVVLAIVITRMEKKYE